MTRFGWNVFAGVGVAGLLVAAPVAQGGQGKQSSTASSDQSSTHGSSTGASASTGSSADPHHESMKKDQLSGKIEKLDQDAQTLTLDSSEKKLKLSDDTRIMKDGARATLSDLQEGDQVRASFSGTGDTVNALVIEVVPGSTGSTRSGDTGSSSSSMGSSSTDTSSSTGSSTSGSTGSSAGSTGSSTGSTGSSTGSTSTDAHPQNPVKPSPGDTGQPKTDSTTK
jgi:hypothetical protein